MSTGTEMRPSTDRVLGMGHVIYEIDMMVKMALRCNEIDRGDERNACVESALVHARNLADFLSLPSAAPSSTWDDIRETDVLEGWKLGRDEDDEKHVCPLQLEVVRRCVKLWTNPGDVVFDPFTGIGTVPYVAVEEGREGLGFELKESYHRQALKNELDSFARRLLSYLVVPGLVALNQMVV